MKKTAVIYWSGTGNTEAMANAVLEGMTAAGADAKLLTVDQVNTAELNGYAAIAFGCPAMGSEVLEEMEFQPMFDACKNCLGGKAVALFGSYGWGDGEWMRSWEKDCADAGVNLVCDSAGRRCCRCWPPSPPQRWYTDEKAPLRPGGLRGAFFTAISCA